MVTGNQKQTSLILHTDNEALVAVLQKRMSMSKTYYGSHQTTGSALPWDQYSPPSQTCPWRKELHGRCFVSTADGLVPHPMPKDCTITSSNPPPPFFFSSYANMKSMVVELLNASLSDDTRQAYRQTWQQLTT